MTSFVHVDQPHRPPRRRRAPKRCSTRISAARRSFDGARGTAQPAAGRRRRRRAGGRRQARVDTWTEGRLLAAWIVLWARWFRRAGAVRRRRAPLAARCRRLPRRAPRAAPRRAPTRGSWPPPQHDPRVMHELQADRRAPAKSDASLPSRRAGAGSAAERSRRTRRMPTLLRSHAPRERFGRYY